MTDDLPQLLHRFLRQHYPDGELAITGLRQMGVGRSRENWLFDLEVLESGRRQRKPLILRRDRDGGLIDTDRATEFALLRALEPCPVPTPVARWLDATGDQLGRPSLIMHRERGSCEYRILNSDRPEAVRLRLAWQLCDLLADVHAIDWQGLGIGELLRDPGPNAAASELKNWVEALRANQLEAHPELELAIDWFAAHSPQSTATVLVHADFKPGNVLIEEDHVVALLDWELAHLGDPLEDLGWVTQPLRHREHLIAGRWTATDLIHRYTSRTGREVDSVALNWWQTFATFKTAVMQVSGLRAFLEGRSSEPYRLTERVLITLLRAVTAAREGA